jgi:hypothetical protein
MLHPCAAAAADRLVCLLPLPMPLLLLLLAVSRHDTLCQSPQPQASLEAGVAAKDMCERPFLEVLAQREVARRSAEAAQAARLV